MSYRCPESADAPRHHDNQLAAAGSPLMTTDPFYAALPELACCRLPNCVHQLHQLVYCYYGFRPFLDNAQVQLSDDTARASPPAEEARPRGSQSRRRTGRGQATPTGRTGGRTPRTRPPAGAERSAPARTSTPTSATSPALTAASTGPTQRQAHPRAATPTQTPPAGVRSRTSASGQKQERTAPRIPAAPPPARISTPTPAAASASSAAPPAPILPAATPANVSAPSASRSLAPKVTLCRIPESASAPVLRAAAGQPSLEPDGHLATILDRLSLGAAPPGALPAFVRVPPPVEPPFCGSRSHGSLEVQLGRCRVLPPPPRRRRWSGGTALAETEEVASDATYDEEPPCCPEGRGHRDSYDPRLDVLPAGEERSRDQARSERLLKNFDMFRDWNYIPFMVEPVSRSRGHHRRADSVDSSDGDSDHEPTVTICNRVGGVFHYIPAQRLVKTATGCDVTTAKDD